MRNMYYLRLSSKNVISWILLTTTTKLCWTDKQEKFTSDTGNRIFTTCIGSLKMNKSLRISINNGYKYIQNFALSLYLYYTCMYMYFYVPSVCSVTRRGWRCGLTPLPSFRSKVHTVIWEILPYIQARFAFKLDQANFPTHIICLHITSYYLTITITIAFSTLFYLLGNVNPTKNEWRPFLMSSKVCRNRRLETFHV